MDTEINWQKVVIMFIAVSSVAFIFFLLGRKSTERVVIAPTVMPENISVQKTVEPESVPLAEEPNTYKNEQYGFGVISLAQAQESTECQAEAKYAYDPVREYIFSDTMVECAGSAIKDHEDFYTKQGGQLETLVFDITKCDDAVTDKVEKVFCDKYVKTAEIEGSAVGARWPTGKWIKSGEYLTFFTPLASQNSDLLRTQYKFLMRTQE